MSKALKGFLGYCIVSCLLFFVGIASAEPTRNSLSSNSLSSNPLPSTSLLFFDQPTFSVILTYESDKYFLKVQSKQGALGEPDVFVLSNPSRIVVDVPGMNSKKYISGRLQHSFVKGIRIGVHPDKLRVVVDIMGSKPPNFLVSSVSANGTRTDRVTVVFNKNTVAPIKAPSGRRKVAQVNRSDNPKTTPMFRNQGIVKSSAKQSSSKQMKSSTSSSAKIKIKLSASEVLSRLATVKQTVRPTNSNAETKLLQPMLNSISFNDSRAGMPRAIVFGLTAVGTRQLNRLDMNVYKLILNNTSVKGEHLLRPMFPPQGFKGLELISTKKSGKDLIVTIYVSDTIRLKDYVKDGTLLIEVIQ